MSKSNKGHRAVAFIKRVQEKGHEIIVYKNLISYTPPLCYDDILEAVELAKEIGKELEAKP